MNKACLTGRLTATPVLSHTKKNSLDVCTFVVAVSSGLKHTDFIRVVAWRAHAAFVAKYFKKGQGIEITGRITSRIAIDSNGKNVYITEVVAEQIDFVKSNRATTVIATPVSEDKAESVAQPVPTEFSVDELCPDVSLPDDDDYYLGGWKNDDDTLS